MLNAPVLPTLFKNAEEDPTTTYLQNYLADLTGHAAALLLLSGTASNQVCLRSALGAPPHSVLVDHRGHIVTMEAGAVSSLSGSLVKAVVPSNGHHLRLSDVQKNVTLTEEVYDCPTRLINLENTLNGTIIPLAEVQAISSWARSQNPPIHMHLDGARLWEAVAAGAGSLKDYCQAFDSVSLCFTKGLGAPLGSIIVGSEAFIKRARVVRKLLGGGMRQSSLIAGPAIVAVEETFLGGKLWPCHEKAKRIASMWKVKGGRLTYPTETNMVWLDLDHAGVSNEAFHQIAEGEGLKVMKKGRLVLHHQITEDAVIKLGILIEKIWAKGNQSKNVKSGIERQIDSV